MDAGNELDPHYWTDRPTPAIHSSYTASSYTGRRRRSALRCNFSAFWDDLLLRCPGELVEVHSHNFPPIIMPFFCFSRLVHFHSPLLNRLRSCRCNLILNGIGNCSFRWPFSWFVFGRPTSDWYHITVTIWLSLPLLSQAYRVVIRYIFSIIALGSKVSYFANNNGGLRPWAPASRRRLLDWSTVRVSIPRNEVSGTSCNSTGDWGIDYASAVWNDRFSFSFMTLNYLCLRDISVVHIVILLPCRLQSHQMLNSLSRRHFLRQIQSPWKVGWSYWVSTSLMTACWSLHLTTQWNPIRREWRHVVTIAVTLEYRLWWPEPRPISQKHLISAKLEWIPLPDSLIHRQTIEKKHHFRGEEQHIAVSMVKRPSPLTGVRLNSSWTCWEIRHRSPQDQHLHFVLYQDSC
jgi:hypothetical protein